MHGQILKALERSNDVKTKLDLTYRIERSNDCFRNLPALNEDVFLDLWKSIYALEAFDSLEFLIGFGNSSIISCSREQLKAWSDTPIDEVDRKYLPSGFARKLTLQMALALARANLVDLVNEIKQKA
ncbi:MAG: hypothetical protein LR008_00770 [Candidatus Pacebacteria bacterium]|nr:hypothetical protein [Candidatus Paceibacterota bacterium]